jgi:hypothetical protein
MSASTMVKRVSVAADAVVRPPDGVTVLIYHRVGGGSDSAVDLDPDVFDRQLAHLVAHHRVLSLGDALAELAGNAAATRGATPAVVLTFDDGTDRLRRSRGARPGAPRRARHPLRGHPVHRPAGRSSRGARPPTSWAGLRDAVSTGLRDHRFAHPLALAARPAGSRRGIASDLDRSIELIGEQHLGVAPVDFAYPKASPASPAAEIEVRAPVPLGALAGAG